MIKEMAKGYKYIKMEIIMKVYYIFIIIINFIIKKKVNGTMIRDMAKGYKYIKMEILMKVYKL